MKDSLTKIANPASTIDSDQKSQCDHVLEDVFQSLRTENKINATVNNDENTTDYSIADCIIETNDMHDEIIRFFH